MEDVGPTGFPLPDSLKPKACIHCAPVFLARSGLIRQPNFSDQNATITFVRFRGETYGITCDHVVKILQRKRPPDGIGMAHDFLIVGDKWFFLREDPVQPETPGVGSPDLAICKLTDTEIATLGREPIPIQDDPPELDAVTHAFAFGFPDKQKIQQPNGTITLRCVMALAENISKGSNRTRFALFSQIDAISPVADFSGMSGGPIYWTTEEQYGLLGITYEALPPNPTETSKEGALVAGPRIHILGEMVTPGLLAGWLEQLGW